MAPSTTFLGMSYPEENQDPYYEVLSSFFDQIDQNIYTNFAQNQILTGGGTLSITRVDENTKRFSWTEDFQFPVLATGKTIYVRFAQGTSDRFIDLVNGDRLVFDIYLTSSQDVVLDLYKINGGLTQEIAPIPRVFTLGVMMNGQFYTALKNYLGQEVSIDGALGLGTQGDSDPAAKLHVFTNGSDDASALKGIVSDARPSVTADTTYNTTVIFAGNREPDEPTMVIPAGVTNSGFFHGVRSEAIRTNTVDQGALSSLAAFSGYFGHATSLNGSASTANAYGLLLTPNHRGGSISNSYGIYIAEPLIGGTVTNAYGIYQANEYKNALFGPVGIGKIPETGTTTGFTTQTFLLDVATADDLIFRGKGTSATKSAQLHFFNNQDKGLRLTAYGSSYSGTTELGVGSNGVCLVTDASGPFAIGTLGVSQPLIFATNSVERLRIDASGNIGVGVSALVRLHAAQSGGSVSQFLDSHHSSPFSAVVGRTSRGTQASPSATQSGDILFHVGGRGYGTSAFASASRSGIEVFADQAWTNSAQGAGLRFFTTAANGTVTTNKMWLSADGSLGIGTDTPDQLLEVSRSTDGAAIRLTSTQNDALHSTVNPFTAVEFFSNDASGPGASVRARVGAQFVDASGAGTALTFSTSTSAGLVEALRIDNFGTLQFAGSISNGLSTFANADLFSLRTLKWRDAAKTQAAQAGDTLVYNATDGVWLAAAGVSGGGGGGGGSTWRAGAGAPSNSTGVDGDFWLNTVTGDVYSRSSGTYSLVTNISGSPGDSSIQGMIESPLSKTYVLIEKATTELTIDSFTARLALGTAQAKLQIDGVDVTGASSVSVSSTQSTVTATGANVVSVGARLTLVVQNPISASDLSFSVEME